MKSIRYYIYYMKVKNKKAKDREMQFELDAFKQLSQIPKSYTYHGTYIPIHRNNGITEIDLIVVNCHGIFCFEVKYTKHPFIGSQDAQFWYKKGTHQRIRNPFIQNRYHVEALATYLGMDAALIKNCVLVNQIDQPLPDLFTLKSAMTQTRSTSNRLSQSEIRSINRLLLKRQRWMLFKKWKHRRYRKKMILRCING
ncbi:NERD domain-containing protein [Erysipelothrix piscisicarius]|uniref:NERD domain-containing protein n=1 Tax=Erysipelothrix piscisicarius TaxID=2485784 RepID=A0A3S8RN85_9FIRM|nr:nuclease-related domain-containing protein [Erysipelothrix piscisicarius]AZK44400.1 NERD domain-containing protein [Erysipelothrix piscisicarius]